MIHDAVVVGAGLSGLVCARRLRAAGASVIVLEARERVGGRLHTGRLGDGIVDLGGQWISSGQPRVVALAAELGIATKRHLRRGNVLLDEGKPGLFAQLGAAIATWRAVRRIHRTMRSLPADTAHVLDAMGPLGDAARELDAMRPLGDTARELDAIAVDTWLASTIRNRIARDRIALHAELVFAASPADLSLLGYLGRLGATGGFAPPGPDLPGGGREHRITGGAQSLALAIAEELGNCVRLAEPVIAIDESGEPAERVERVERAERAERDERDERAERVGDRFAERAGGAEPAEHGERGLSVTVRSATHEHRARRVVLAVPPILARSIAVDLGPAARAFAEATRVGPVVKCFASYDRAFWREAGWSGEAYRPRGTVRATVEIVTGGAPTLLAFVVGAAAAGWAARDLAERRAEILAILVEQFGPRAASPIDYLDVDWGADPWSAGCVASVPRGVLSAGARWRESRGRIHVAGTESATAWPGYMEGAIEAGERAATEVLAALGI